LSVGLFSKVATLLLEEPGRPLSLLEAVGLQVTETKQYLVVEEEAEGRAAWRHS
jgi:hypothetical protein